MTWRLLRTLDPARWHIIIIFANTGQEHEETLRFVRRCAEYMGFDVIWLEAVIDPRKGPGRGPRARVVTFETAARNGEPFETYIAKHGIPNVGFPGCTRDLKSRPIAAYLRTLGWRKGRYLTAIGLRADEVDRVASDREERKLWYPLIEWDVDKAQVLEFWRQQNFDLEIPEHLGNCTWCWKKSLRKHLTLAKDFPRVFSFPERMEELHAFSGPGSTGEPRRFFRGNRTVAELRRLAAEPFEPFVDENMPAYDEELDTGSGCGESCEIGADT